MTIHLLVLMCVLSHSGFGGSRVVLSLYALDQGATQLTIGILMALYAVCPLFLAVFVGRFADRVGPRVPMLIGIGGVVLGLLLPPIFPGVATLYLSALMLGSTFHFFFITVQGITGGIGGAENRSRNFALIGMGFSAAGFIGPFLAGLTIDHFGHLEAFLMLAAFPVPALLLLLFKPGFLPRARKHAGGAQHGSSLELLHVRSLRNTFIASGILSAAWDLFQFYFPVYGHSLGLSASAIGTVLGVFALATFTVRVVIPALAKRYAEAADADRRHLRCRFRLRFVSVLFECVRAGRDRFPSGTRSRLRSAGVDVAHLRACATGTRCRVRGSARDSQQRHAPSDTASLRERRNRVRLHTRVPLELIAARRGGCDTPAGEDRIDVTRAPGLKLKEGR